MEVVSDSPTLSTEGVSKNPSQTDTDDFMSLAGMWEGQDISAEKIRAGAWPTRK